MNQILFTFALITSFFCAEVNALKLRVVTENLYPYNYMDKGVVKGMSTEIVKKVLDNAGIDYEITVYPGPEHTILHFQEPNVLIYTIIRIPTPGKTFSLDSKSAHH